MAKTATKQPTKKITKAEQHKIDIKLMDKAEKITEPIEFVLLNGKKIYYFFEAMTQKQVSAIEAANKLLADMRAIVPVNAQQIDLCIERNGSALAQGLLFLEKDDQDNFVKWSEKTGNFNASVWMDDMPAKYSKQIKEIELDFFTNSCLPLTESDRQLKEQMNVLGLLPSPIQKGIAENITTMLGNITL